MKINVVKIPEKINYIAIPTEWLSFIEGDRIDILVIKKTNPKSDVYYCGARHRFIFKLDMLPRGGIKLFHQQEGGLRRRLKYGELVVEDISRNWLHKKGYLVFKRIGNEWKIEKDEEPEAYVYVKHYSMNSRVACAEYKLLKAENVLAHAVDSTCCATFSVAAMLLILPTTQPAVIEYEYVKAPYRGDSERLRNRVRIEWNNGKPVEKEVEEITEEEII